MSFDLQRPLQSHSAVVFSSSTKPGKSFPWKC